MEDLITEHKGDECSSLSAIVAELLWLHSVLPWLLPCRYPQNHGHMGLRGSDSSRQPLPSATSMLRPLAVTGVIGPNFPTSSTTNDVRNPTTLTWAFTLQYSLMYLQSVVKDVGLGQPFNRMVVVVEFPMETCLNTDCKNQTTGTVNPGITWIGKFTELGIAAEIPMNPRSGAGTGIFALFHLFIDDLFPKGIGRPIFP